MAGQPQSPWDVMWEYILDDFESDDDDDTLPTVSTRGTLETDEDAGMPITLIKDQWMKAAKGISDFTQTNVEEERDENGSNRYTWRQSQKKPDTREKNETRKVRWSRYGVKKQLASKTKKSHKKGTNGSILDKASQAAVAISTSVKEVKWEEAGDALIGIFDVVQPNHVLVGDQSFSDSSSGDSESKGYSYNSVEDDSVSHHDARVERGATRAFGRHHKAKYDDPESFLDGSRTMDYCFKKSAVRRGSHKKMNRSVNDHRTDSTGTIVRIPFSTRTKETGHGRDTTTTECRNGTNHDGPNQLTRKFACFAKIENNELDVIHQLDDMDSKFFFPSARMVSDLDGQNPISLQMNAKIGLMGIPPDNFLGSKGPQSVYSYEYQCKLHMDIAYTKFGGDPNDCISIRKFESVPTIRPEDGNRVLVQVEVSWLAGHYARKKYLT